MSHPIAAAESLETEGKLAEAVQVYEDILNTTDGPSTLALVNFRLGAIYYGWRELFTAQRFFAQAHQLDPSNADIRDAIAELNQHFSENREAVADEMSRKNSDQIVSLFRIATGIKLLTMDKPVQAYPLLKSRTKIFRTLLWQNTSSRTSKLQKMSETQRSISYWRGLACQYGCVALYNHRKGVI